MARSHLTQYKAAAKDFKKATELAPKEAIYWLELSQNYARIAESTAESAKSLSPKKLRDWYVVGERYWNAGDITQALSVWVDFDPGPSALACQFAIRAVRPEDRQPHCSDGTLHASSRKEAPQHHVLENMIQVHNQQGLYAQAEKFRARYLEQRRKQIGRGYAPSRTPHRRIRPRPRFVVDQFRVGRYDIVASEWVNRRKTDAHYAFATTTSAKGGPTFTLELDPDQVTHRLIKREFTPGVASGLGGLNAKLPPPPPPPPPGRTIKTYAQAPTYGDVKRDVIAVLRGESRQGPRGSGLWHTRVAQARVRYLASKRVLAMGQPSAPNFVRGGSRSPDFYTRPYRRFGAAFNESLSSTNDGLS